MEIPGILVACGIVFFRYSNLVFTLKIIFGYTIFENPANGKYDWVGSEKVKVFFLNTFRWSKDMIPWCDMLLLLKGQTVKSPAPKNIYSDDIVISTDVAIFPTSNSSIKYRGPYNASDDRGTELMATRWKNDQFRRQFFSQEQKKCASQPKVFCKICMFWLKACNFHFYKTRYHSLTKRATVMLHWENTLLLFRMLPKHTCH